MLHRLPEGWAKRFPFLGKIYKKKFDIRVWVLVKSFHPLVFYIYDEGYLRISASPYQLDSLSNEKGHLMNFTTNYKKPISADKSKPNEEDSYVLLNEFVEFIEAEYGHFGLKHSIHRIIELTLESVEISQQSNSFEFYGFDVILDGKLKAWVLECNLSPACKERGRLKNVLYKMGKGLLNIMGFIKS